MKKILPLLAFLLFLLPNWAKAETFPVSNIYQYQVDRFQVTANGKDSAKVIFTAAIPTCYFSNDADRRDAYLDYFFAVGISSGTASLNKTTLKRTSHSYGAPYHDASMDCGGDQPTNNAKKIFISYETLQITSTQANAVIFAYNYAAPGHISPRAYWPKAIKPINFVKTTTTATTTVTTTTKTTTAQTANKPTISFLKINDAAYEGGTEYNLFTGEAVDFYGQTVVNGKVTLTFNSNPFTDTTTADENGNWKYTLKENLGAGWHSMTYAVTDPANGLTSDPSPSISFRLSERTEGSNELEKKILRVPLTYIYGIGIMLFLAFSIIAFIVFKKKRNKAELTQD